MNLGKDLAADVGSLDTLIFHGTRETEIQQRLNSTRTQLFDIQKGLRDVRVKKEEIDGKGAFQTSRQKELFVPISTTISANEGILDDDFREEFRKIYRDPTLKHGERADRLSSILSTVSFSKTASADGIEAFTREVRDVLSSLSQLQLEISGLNVAFQQVKNEETILLSEVDTAEQKVQELEKVLSESRKALNDEHRALIASFENSLGGIPYALIKIPTIILTLIVTIAAGGLGSVVAFTRKFRRGQRGTGVGRVLVNIGEGVAAAIAIFLFAGTGMLMLTQGAAGTEGNVELSPYMVAFVAFVSGFMSEDAFSKIQEQGKKLFGVEELNHVED